MAAAWKWIRKHAILIGTALIAVLSAVFGALLVRKKPSPLAPALQEGQAVELAIDTLQNQRKKAEDEAAAIEFARTVETEAVNSMGSEGLAAEWARLRKGKNG